MINITPLAFQKSINQELKDIQNRVRNLIGSANWGADGLYKEAILRKILKNFLPSNLSVGSGFIIKHANENYIASTQIDIIIYDNTYPLLFSDGDFIITTPSNVRGVIEVKTNIGQNNIRDTIKKATNVGLFVGHTIFIGIFSYNNSENIHKKDILDKLLKEDNGVINHIVLGENIFIKFWEKGEKPFSMNCDNKANFSIYQLENLSFAYFISNLVEIVSQLDLTERFWVMYPIPKGKEHYHIRDICLDN